MQGNLDILVQISKRSEMMFQEKLDEATSSIERQQQEFLAAKTQFPESMILPELTPVSVFEKSASGSRNTQSRDLDIELLENVQTPPPRRL